MRKDNSEAEKPLKRSRSLFIGPDGYTKGKFNNKGEFKVDWDNVPVSPENLALARLIERQHTYEWGY